MLLLRGDMNKILFAITCLIIGAVFGALLLSAVTPAEARGGPRVWAMTCGAPPNVFANEHERLRCNVIEINDTQWVLKCTYRYILEGKDE